MKSAYQMEIYWSEEDEAFVGVVPALPGCVSHGDTLAEAATNLGEAMELWLETAVKYGDPLPEAGCGVRISPLLNVSALAERAGINKHTLRSKMERNSPLTAAEMAKMVAALMNELLLSFGPGHDPREFVRAEYTRSVTNWQVGAMRLQETAGKTRRSGTAKSVKSKATDAPKAGYYPAAKNTKKSQGVGVKKAAPAKAAKKRG